MMAQVRLLCWVLVTASVVSQQIPGSLYDHETLGLSDSCFNAVNTTVSSCPAWLPVYIGFERPTVAILNSVQLNDLCNSTCRSDLEQVRKQIQSACTSPNDVMVPVSVAYPATYIVDRYLYAANLSCLTDPSTGKYCDLLTTQYANSGNEYSTAQQCSPCELKYSQIQLESPFGYDEDEASYFSSITSSCSATGYAYASPTVYGLNATTSTASATPTCTSSSYNVQATDTCVTISGANHVSTFSLIQENNLDITCSGLYENRTLCLPPSCKTFQLQMTDTCDSLIRDLHMTKAQLLAWNPMLDSGCWNLASWRGWYLCASSMTGTATVKVGNSDTTPAPVPQDAQSQSNKYCSQWYEVQSGDYCAAISLKFKISLDDFYFLNPQVDRNCTNLWLATSYCVRAVGDIETYSGYPVSTAPYTFTKPPAVSFTPVPIIPPPLSPHAPGTLTNCTLYENAFSSGDAFLNSCKMWASDYKIEVSSLLAWNPSLSTTNCSLQAGYSYCLDSGVPPAPPVPVFYDWCSQPNNTLIPSTSLQPSNCDCYIQLQAADQKVFKCSQFPDLFNITVADLTTLNSWIGTDCDTGLWSKMSTYGFEQLCVHKKQ